VKRLAAAAALALSWAAAPCAEAAQAKILSTEGRVESRVSGGEWRRASVDELLPQGSEVATGPDGRCEIGFFDGAKGVIRVQEDSRAVIVSLDPVRVDLQSGRLMTLVKNLKRGSQFQVATPTAIATVRGTGWEQDKNRVLVYESAVDVMGSSGQTREVGEGMGVEISDDGGLGELFELPEDAKERWSEFRDQAGNRLENASTDSLNEITANDPSDEFFESRDAFEDLQAEQHLEDKLNEKPENNGGGGGQISGGTTG
jgi:hypothetical protein